MNFQTQCMELLGAICNDNLERVKQLVDSGIPVTTVLHDPSQREHATVLGSAAYKGQVEIVKYLLSIPHTSVNYKDPRSSWNALHWAAFGGSSEVIEVLLEHGADVNAKDRDNVTALIRAAIRGHSSALKLLIDQGADVNHHDRLHSSALHYASFYAFGDVTEALIKGGCVANNSSVLGQGTPLANLFYHGDVANCSLLIAAGYDLRDEHDWIELMNPNTAISGLHDELASFLFDAVANPRSLKSLCRCIIRAQFRGCSVEAKIKRLPLPKQMIEYLSLAIF